MSTRNLEIDHVRSIQEKYTDQLMAKPHVLGVSLGQDEPNDYGVRRLAIVVLVEREVSDYELSPEDRIPDSLEGVPVLVQEIGTIETMW